MVPYFFNRDNEFYLSLKYSFCKFDILNVDKILLIVYLIILIKGIVVMMIKYRLSYKLHIQTFINKSNKYIANALYLNCLNKYVFTFYCAC